MKIKVGVFFGGRSVEHEVSIISALQTINAIDKAKYDTIPIYITKQGTWYSGEALLKIENYQNIDQLLSQCQNIQLAVTAKDNLLLKYPAKLFQKQVFNTLDVAFPVFHGTYGEDGAFQGLFEINNLPYVGCDVLSSAVGINKIAMKLMLKAADLPIVNYLGLYGKEWLKNKDSVIENVEKNLSYPLIVKPATLGSSIGITKVNNRKELEAGVEIAKSFSPQLLLEEIVPNLKEINSAVLGDYEKTEVSVCEEPLGNEEVLSFQDKYTNSGSSKGMSGAKRKLPADIPTEMAKTIQDLARQTFLLLNCSGVARIDFLVNTESNQIYVNEINTIPGSLAFYLWKASGKSFTDLTSELIQLALKRQREKNNLVFTYDSNILTGFQGSKAAKF